ncbi:MAG: hypothetical protein ACI9G1_002237 [Pirellulaceae bacterium]
MATVSSPHRSILHAADEIHLLYRLPPLRNDNARNDNARNDNARNDNARNDNARNDNARYDDLRIDVCNRNE